MIASFALEPGDLCLGSRMIPVVYSELQELREGGTLEQVTARILATIEPMKRTELLAVVDGQLVGFACVAEDDDMHVGRCLTLQWQYVVPEHRGKIGSEFLRWLARFARCQGFQFIAYSHRVSARHYAIKYRRISHGEEG
jgi:GNAT superfamily N-acetyltransferase